MFNCVAIASILQYLCFVSARYWFASSIGVRKRVSKVASVMLETEALVAVKALEEKGFTKSEARARALMPTPGGRARPSAVKG